MFIDMNTRYSYCSKYKT